MLTVTVRVAGTFTQVDLARKIGITPSFVSKMLNGILYPGPQVMKRIDRAIAWSIEDQIALIPDDGMDNRYGQELAREAGLYSAPRPEPRPDTAGPRTYRPPRQLPAGGPRHAGTPEDPWTVTALCQALGVSKTIVVKYRNGTAYPGADIREGIAELLNWPVREQNALIRPYYQGHDTAYAMELRRRMARPHRVKAEEPAVRAEKRRWTGKDLGKALGISQPSISNYMLGYAYPQREIREALAELLDWPVREQNALIQPRSNRDIAYAVELRRRMGAEPLKPSPWYAAMSARMAPRSG
jgi:transcriptional regulator with XRE-family HTH domain